MEESGGFKKISVVVLSLIMLGCGVNPAVSVHSKPKGFKSTSGTAIQLENDTLPFNENLSGLQSQVLALEDRLEEHFRPPAMAGGVVSIQTEGKESGKIVDTDGGDSALWSGTYLASLCFHYQAVGAKSADSIKVRERISSMLNTMNIYAHVSGVPGLLARMVYQPGSPDFPAKALKKSGTYGLCKQEIRWEDGQAPLNQYAWCGYTSRDQYAGFFFGLSVCQEALKTAPELQEKSATLALETALELQKNGWTVPFGKYERIWPPFSARNMGGFTAFSVSTIAARSAEILLTRQPGSAATLNAALSRFNQEKKNLEPALWMDLFNNQVWLNDFYHYYPLHLDYLRIYPVFLIEKDPEIRKLITQYFFHKLWLPTMNHQNTFFTFIRFSVTGASLPSDVRSWGVTQGNALVFSQARSTLYRLAQRPRNNLGSAKNPPSDCQPHRLQAATRHFTELMNDKLKHPIVDDFLKYSLGSPRCQNVLPISQRIYRNYYWEADPFEPARNEGDGHVHSPAVDTLLAYWLGRASGLILGGE